MMREVTEKPDGSNSVYNYLLKNLGDDRNAENWISYPCSNASDLHD